MFSALHVEEFRGHTMRSVDDTNPAARTRTQRWRNGRRIKTVRWVEVPPPKRITPEKQGKKRPGTQMRLSSCLDPATGFTTNFVWSDE